MPTITCSLARLLCLVLLAPALPAAGQISCSPEALTAKYWQYRERFNKHFVMNDRKPEGCVGNGITRNETDFSSLDCSDDLLHGYGLPATSIVQTISGAHSLGLGVRNQDPPHPKFHNPNCDKSGPSPGTNWNPTINGVPISSDFPPTGQKFNYIEYGSETPSQLGWYMVVLTTEYELLGRSGQYEEQQRTLEELFLALQAYRRLDITANCLVKKRYDEITDGFEVDLCSVDVQGNLLGGVLNQITVFGSCLCPEVYHNSQCTGKVLDGLFHDNKWHFDIPCFENCPWQPNLTGFSGFAIRNDETQEQEALHDPSEQMWNIDLVSGSFAMSEAPPCADNFSKPCFMEYQVGYMSQDQIFSIMMGLAMVKRYIPANATVTTCDGETFQPLAIAQDISNGIVKMPQNGARNQFWPGSDSSECCAKPVKFGPCAGGDYTFSYAYLEMMHNYIDPARKHKIGIYDRIPSSVLFQQQGHPNFNRVIEGLSFGSDLANLPDRFKNPVSDYAYSKDKEIFILMNNLLYPGGNQLPVDRSLFEEMLCSAPCGGPCIKQDNYETQGKAAYYPDFDCPNTPKWTGQRWEGPNAIPEWEEVYKSRQMNGLDYMALHNIYMLHFSNQNTHTFTNPDRPLIQTIGNPKKLLGEDKIEGPITLCPGQTAQYRLIPSYSPATINPIEWSSTPNITLSTSNTNPTNATLVSSLTPSYLRVDFEEKRNLQQYHNGVLATETVIISEDPPVTQNLPIWINEQCNLTYYKPIISEVPEYQIVTEMDFCQWIYKASAHGPEYARATTLTWLATDSNTGLSVTSSGLFLDLLPILPNTPDVFGQITILLTVQNDCGTVQHSLVAPYITCGTPSGGGTQNRQIIVTPNPANNQIAVQIRQNQTQDFNSTDPNGVRIRIYPLSGGSGTLMDSYLYNNGQIFNATSIPNGLYKVIATAADLPPIQTNLAIVR